MEEDSLEIGGCLKNLGEPSCKKVGRYYRHMMSPWKGHKGWALPGSQHRTMSPGTAICSLWELPRGQ